MFTQSQIKEAHAKVKSGADFPQYIQDIIALGVHHYETYVADGHTRLFGKGGYTINTQAKYATLEICESTDAEKFTGCLKVHQQGRTGYTTFCTECAACGIEKWIVQTDAMTCTYYDKAGNEVLQETIPG